MAYRYDTPHNPHIASIGELLGRRGQSAANRALRVADAQSQAALAKGQAWGQGLSSIGQTLAAIPQQMQQQKQDAQREKVLGLQIEEREGRLTAQKQAAAQDQAFFKMLEGGVDPIEAAKRTYGPSERGANVLKGIAAFTELQQGPVTDARDTAGRLALGVKSLSPSTQAQFWPQIRAAAVKGGLGDEQAIPEQPNPEYLDAVIGWATGKEAPTKAAEGFTLSPGQQRFDAQGQPIANVPAPPVAPPRPVSVPEGGVLVDPVTGKVVARGNPKREPAGQRSPIWVVGPDGEFQDLAGVAPPGSKPASSREQGRAVTSGDAGRIAELDSSIDDLAVLRQTVLPVDPKTGKPSEFKTTGTKAKAGAVIPNWATELTGWGADAKSRQAVIDRVKQVIGKALEDGVLRKEDERKYEKILPTIGDVASVVATKLEGLDKAVALRKQRILESLADAGYDTSRFTERSGDGATNDPLGIR